ncbi:MAG: heavy metal sensor histidine kinase [Armatimonadota bacterium]|nr:heavy metal sensor histidine kinase [Armatimonadota bacterium]
MFRGIRASVVLPRSAALALVLAAFELLIYSQFARELRTAVDNALRYQAEYAGYLFQHKNGDRELARLADRIVPHSALPSDRKLIRILGPDGDTLSEWGPADLKRANGVVSATHAIRSNEYAYETTVLGRSDLRFISLPVSGDRKLRYVVQVATPLDRMQATLSRMRFLLILCGVAMLSIMTAGGWFITGRALSPVRKMAATARRIGAGKIDERLVAPDSGDEIEELARTFNDMIDRLEGAYRQVKRFTADASHELRTPLTIMKGEIEVALRKARSPEAQEQVLRSALEEINHMSKIVDRLLTLARIDSGEAVLEMATVDLDETLRAACRQYEPLARARGCELVVRSASQSTVRGDKQRLMELVGNLLDNSIKYSPTGGSIEVTLSPRNHGFVISVTDMGVGIASKDLPRVFERFYRGQNSRTRHVQGSGLGLSICKWIAETHGGRIEVRSQIGKGSTFAVWLPSLAADVERFETAEAL